MTVKPPLPAGAFICPPGRAAGPLAGAGAAALEADVPDMDDGRRESRYPPPAVTTTAAAARARTFRATVGLPRGGRPPDTGTLPGAGAATGAGDPAGWAPSAGCVLAASAAMTASIRAARSAGKKRKRE